MDSLVYEVTPTPVWNRNLIRSDDTTCSICSKSFKTRFALAQHNKIHYIEKVYACSSCNKRFATKGCLEIHELSHSRDICKLCGNPFSHSSRSNNPKNLCDTCSGCSSSPDVTSREQQPSYGEEESFAGQQRRDSASRNSRRVYVSERQKRQLVQFMEDHPVLIRNHLTQNFTPRDRKRLWEELKLILNSDCDGRVKTVAKWKKCWNDLKSSVKERAAKLKAERGQSGDNPLSDIDERIFLLAKVPSARDQVRIREPSRREGLRRLSLRVELPRIEAPEDFSFSTEDVTSASSSEMKLEENGIPLFTPIMSNHGPGSPNSESEPPVQPDFNVINNERTVEIEATSGDSPDNTSLLDFSPNTSNVTNPNGIRNKRVLLPMTELKEAKAAVISLAETNKETLDAFKRIAEAQERLVALQTKRNEEQRQFETKLLLMVEGLLTHVQKK